MRNYSAIGTPGIKMDSGLSVINKVVIAAGL